METPIKQIWGFDSMYGSETKAEKENKKITFHVASVVTDWLSFVTSRQDITFFFHGQRLLCVTNEFSWRTWSSFQISTTLPSLRPIPPRVKIRWHITLPS